MRYAITGATGFVGGALARQLRDAGHEVRALVRDPARATALADLGVELVPGRPRRHRRARPAVRRRGRPVPRGRLVQARRSATPRSATASTSRAPGTCWPPRSGPASPRTVYTSTLAVNSDTHGRGARRERSVHIGEHVSHYDRTKAEAHAVAEAVRRRRSAGRDRAARAGLRPRRHRADRRARRARSSPGKRPAGAGRRRASAGRTSTTSPPGTWPPMERGEPGERRTCWPGRGPRWPRADEGRRDRRHEGPPMVLPTGLVRVTATLTGCVGRVVPLPPTFAAETHARLAGDLLRHPRQGGARAGLDGPTDRRRAARDRRRPPLSRPPDPR